MNHVFVVRVKNINVVVEPYKKYSDSPKIINIRIIIK